MTIKPSRAFTAGWTAAGAVVVALLLPASSGCGDWDKPPGLKKKSVAIEEVPKNVSQAAKTTLPGVSLSDAWENVDAEGKLHSYEIRGRVPKTGKIREARITPEGKVLEVE